MRSTLLLFLSFSAIAGQPAPVDSPPVRIGLALSGGAALGLAHIGVLKVLEEEGIHVCCVSGTSMGSLVGGVYCAGFTPLQMESIALRADWDRLFSSMPSFGSQFLPERQQSQRYFLQLRHNNLVPFLPSGLVPLQNVEFLLMELLSEVEFNTGYNFDSLPIPYRAVAVNLSTGQKAVLRQGRLEQAIRASIAIPAVFAPEQIENEPFVDGGVLSYLPVEALDEFQPDLRIASLTRRRTQERNNTLIDVAFRSIELATAEGLAREKNKADVVIEPDLDRFAYSDFPRARELIAAGESAARAALPLIREKLQGRRPVAARNDVRPRTMPWIRSVRFEGLKVTSELMLHRELRTQRGKRLDFRQLLADMVRLFNTGLFEHVNYQIEPGGADSVDIVLVLEERPYGFYSFGLRFDNVDNLVMGIEAGQGNIRGSGASVRAALVLGNPNELRLGVTGTRLFWLPFGYRLDGFSGTINHRRFEFDSAGRSWAAYHYQLRYLGGVAEMGTILGRNAFFNIGLKGYQADYSGQPVDTLNSSWVAGPTFQLVVNNLNNLHLPTSGTSLRLATLYSTSRLANAENFLKAELNADQITPLSSRLGLRFGSDIGFSLGRLPLCEEFRTGPGQLVGFPADRWTAAHRLLVARIGVHYRLFHLFNLDNYPVFIQVRADCATFEGPDSLRRLGENWETMLHWGAGLALLTNSPIGPFQITFGYGDFGKVPPAGLNIHLSVGREFRYTR